MDPSDNAKEALEHVLKMLRTRFPEIQKEDIAFLLVAPTPEYDGRKTEVLLAQSLFVIEETTQGTSRRRTFAKAYLSATRNAWEAHERITKRLEETLGPGWRPAFYWVVLLRDGQGYALPEPAPPGTPPLLPEEIQVVRGSEVEGERVWKRGLWTFAEEQAATAESLAEAFLARKVRREPPAEGERLLRKLEESLECGSEDLAALLFLPSAITPESEAARVLSATRAALAGLPEEERERWWEALGFLAKEAPPFPDVLLVLGVLKSGEVRSVELLLPANPDRAGDGQGGPS